LLTLRASFQTVFIIALDLSKPWALMDSLKQVTRARPSQRGAPQSSQTHSRAACSAAAAARQWADCLQAALKPKMDSLSAGEQDALRDAVRNHIKNYHTAASEAAAAGGESKDKGEDASAGAADGLTANLGAPLLVVCCKADVMEQQEREAKDGRAGAKFELIQQQVRRFCLKYGAALAYTSGQSGGNCKELQKYLLHRLYPAQFKRVPAELVAREALLVPSGEDSLDHIGAPPAGFECDAPLSEVWPQPVAAAGAEAAAAAAAAAAAEAAAGGGAAKAAKEAGEAEQGWLEKLKGLQVAGPGGSSASSFGASSRPAFEALAAPNKPSALGDDAGGAGGGAGGGATSTPDRKGSVAGSAGKPADPAALSSFFNNLLQRGDRKGSTRGTEQDKQVRRDAAKALSDMQK
jgi:hypothetical protein